MKDLALVPLLKLAYYRSFWLQLALMVLLLFAGVGILASLSNVELAGAQLPLRGFFSFPVVWQNTAWVLRLVHQCLCFFMILLVANDDEHRLLRQHVMEGWSRAQAAASYLALCFFCSLLSLLLVGLVVAVFGLRTGGPLMTLGQAKILACFFLQCFLYSEVVLMLALWLRKPVPTILAFLGWSYLGEPMLGWVLDKRVFDGLSAYLPLHVSGDLLPEPSLLGASLSLAESGVPLATLGLSGLYALVLALLIGAYLHFADL